MYLTEETFLELADSVELDQSVLRFVDYLNKLGLPLLQQI